MRRRIATSPPDVLPSAGSACRMERLLSRSIPRRTFVFAEWGVRTGENFSGEKFSPDPFQKTLDKGEEYGLPDCFTVAGVWCRVGALDVWRSRPAVALRVRLRASPSAQDDTKGRVRQRKLEFTLDYRRYFFSCKLIKSLLLWEKGDHGSGG